MNRERSGCFIACEREIALTDAGSELNAVAGDRHRGVVNRIDAVTHVEQISVVTCFSAQQIVATSTHEQGCSGSSDHGIVTASTKERRCPVSSKDGVVPHSTDQNWVSSPTHDGLVIRPEIRGIKVVKIERDAVGKLGDGQRREIIDEIR